MEDLDEIVHEFLVESHENLDQLDADLVALESTPGSRDLLSSIFRTIHTIKGTSGFLAFHALEKVTHAGENLLVELRDGRRSMDQRTTDVLLEMVDSVREILRAIESTGTEGAVDVAPVVADLEAVLANAEAPADNTPAAPADDAVPADDAAPADDAVPAAPTAEAAPEPAPEAPAEAEPAPAAALTEPKKVIRASKPNATEPEATEAATEPTSAEPEVTETPSAAPATDAAPADLPAPRAVPTEETLPAAPQATPAGAGPATPSSNAGQPGPSGTTDDPSHRSAADSSIRVDVDLLDALMRQVSELVLSRNAIVRIAEDAADVELARASQRLNLIASELQEGVMKTRMQPIEHVWSKVPRMVRDLASGLGRKVRLDMSGGDTELDRSLLEAIKDPLTHLIRNAIDHGIEAPEKRTATGKPEQGVLSLRAYHAGGQVVVEVADDGKGIDPDAVAAKAVERGLRTADQVTVMAPNDLLQLVFLPGFSTADAVTNVSGRGVGMDVVRTRVEAIGGTVDVESQVGAGTTWRLRIPLTLAIMPALTVECADHLYEIPQVSLLELVALDPEAGTAIEYVRSAPVYRLRGELLPIVDLREVFGAEPRAEGERTVVAVLQADTRRFGLVVDRVLNTEEIVVKPLAARLKSIGLYAGATLLGDGRVSLILDVQAIARRTMGGELGEVARSVTETATTAVRTDTTQVLVAGVGADRQVAIPLSAVTRLEQIPAAAVERVGQREVVQYRGAITPVVRLDRVLGVAPADGAPEQLTVVVSTRGTRSVAVVVDRIVDIVDDDAAQHSDVGDQALLGSTVLRDRVTELLDIRAVVAAVDPDFFDEDPAATDTTDLARIDDLVGAS